VRLKRLVVWYLLADGTRARIVTRPKPAAGYVVVFAEDSAAAHARVRDMVSDRPGHGHESAASARHAVEPRHDARRLEEMRFLRSVVAYVNNESARGSFDRLVIYAAPRCLAILRAGLDPATSRKLHGEHAKDLTKVPLAELPVHFGTARGAAETVAPPMKGG
jgi:protein required for attachment to host cells